MNNKMNSVAMEIILHSGNGRAKLHKAMRLSIEDYKIENKEEIESLLQGAKEDINKAHQKHTEFMQNSLSEEETLSGNILFSHAQDTLMTIISEQNMINYMIKLNYSMREEMKNEFKK